MKKSVPTMRDTVSEAVAQEHDMQSNAIRDVFLEALMKHDELKRERRAEMMKDKEPPRIKQARPGTLLRRERIKGDDEPYPVEEARELRMNIIAMSLYPNIYSGLAMTHMGPS
jgi:hypothetical protein